MIGFLTPRLNDYASTLLRCLATHPNVGATLVLESCASQEGHQLLQHAAASGRPVYHIDSRAVGGSTYAVAIGKAWLAETLDGLQTAPRVPFSIADLTIGTICGGSDSTSALSANPGIGLAYDRLIAEGATAIFEETGELIGCDHLMAARATTPAVAKAILAAMAGQRRCELGHGSFAPGNAEGGLRYRGEIPRRLCQERQRPIAGVIRPGEARRRHQALSDGQNSGGRCVVFRRRQCRRRRDYAWRLVIPFLHRPRVVVGWPFRQ